MIILILARLVSSKMILEKSDSELLKLGNFTEKDLEQLRYAASLGVLPHGFQKGI